MFRDRREQKEHSLDVRKESSITPQQERISRTRVYVPRADIIEEPDRVLLSADMPGVTDSAVEITLEKNTLTIHGEIKREETPEGHQLVYSEFQPASYERAFILTSEVNRDAIEAKMRNGVLHVVLPKSEQARAKKIPVQAG